MNAHWLAAALIALPALLGACTQERGAPPEQRALDGARELAAFSLVDHRGREFDRARLLGRWTFVTFGFTSCPDICPTMLVNLAEMRRSLDNGWKGPAPQFVFVSLDPKRDTAELLSKYLSAFHPDFVGVTGTQDAVDRLHKDFGGSHRVGKPDAKRNGYYSVDHSVLLYVVEPNGRLQWEIAPPFDPAEMARRIARMTQAAGKT